MLVGAAVAVALDRFLAILSDTTRFSARSFRVEIFPVDDDDEALILLGAVIPPEPDGRMTWDDCFVAVEVAEYVGTAAGWKFAADVTKGSCFAISTDDSGTRGGGG